MIIFIIGMGGDLPSVTPLAQLPQLEELLGS